MSVAEKLIIGITEADIQKAAGAIAAHLNASEGSFDVANRTILERAITAWLERIVDDVVEQAAWHALDLHSPQRASFNQCLSWELEGQHKRQGE